MKSAVYFLQQILAGPNNLHKLSIVHGNLEHKNILLNQITDSHDINIFKSGFEQGNNPLSTQKFINTFIKLITVLLQKK